MANTILHKRSSTSGTIPSTGSLAQGELGINLADGKLYTKNNYNNIINLGVTSISGTSITPNSGNFLNYLAVNGVPVSVSGHSHTTVQQAESLVTTVFNETGSTISKMTAVYINGGHGDRPTIQKAIATSDATSAGTYGLVYADIDHNQEGQIIVFGSLSGVNTDPAHGGIAGATEGSVLYLSPTTSGAITTTKPYAPDHIVAIGTVIRVHQNEGIIEVRVQNGFELDELHNVAISGATNGQFLQYNSTNGLWVPSSSGNFSSLSVNNTSVSLSGHNHNGVYADIATGDPQTPSNSIVDRAYALYDLPNDWAALWINDATVYATDNAIFDSFKSNMGLSNAVTGTGIANHVAYWNSSSGIVADSGQLYWDSTNNRLGIGITNPLDLIHVSGATTSSVGIRFDNNDGHGGSVQADNGQLYLNSSTATAARLSGRKIRLGDGGASACAIELSSVGTISQDGNGGGLSFSGTIGQFSNGLHVTAGNVGIGTSSPTNRLEVAGGDVLLFPSDNTRQLSLYSSSYGVKCQSGLELFTGDRIRFRKGATEYARIESDGKFGIGTTTPSGQLHVIGSGIFTSGLFINTTPVSISGHTHASSDITNFNSSVSGLLPTISNSGDNRVLTSTGSSVGINAESNLTFDGTTLNAPLIIATQAVGDEGGEIQLAKAPNGSLSGSIVIDSYQNKLRFFENGGTARGFYLDISAGGAGASTNIGGGGSATTVSNYADNRIITSDGTTTGLNAEANFTFNGSLLNVTGSGSFASGLNVANQTASTIASFDANKNIVSLSTSTYPSLTELSYVKGATSSIQTQLNSKQNALTNPVTGTGIINHIAYWSSTSGIVADSDQLYWDSTNHKLGIGTNSPNANLAISTNGAGGTIAGAAQTQSLQVNDGSAGPYINLAHFNTTDSTVRGSFTLSNNGSGAWENNVMQFFVHGASYPYGYYGGNVAQSGDAGCAMIVTQGSEIQKLQIGNYGTAPIEFFTDNNFRAIIDSAGNVGIGTATPSVKLHIYGSSSDISTPIQIVESDGSQSPLTFRLGGTDQAYVKGDDAGNLAFGANNFIAFETGGFGGSFERMRVDINGNVGLGTSSPSEKLDVVGNIKTGDLVLGYNATFDQYGLTNTNGGGAPLYIISDLAAMNLFSSIGITIDADAGNVVLQPNIGNVGIGNSSPTTKLDVTGDVNIDGNLTFDSYTESVVSNGNSGTSKTLDLTTGTVHTCTLTGNCTFTMPTATAGKSFTMFLNTGSGNYTASFSGVRWADSAMPTATILANKVDIYSFISDGSYWYGSFSQNYG